MKKESTVSDAKIRLKIGILLVSVFLLIYIPSFINWVYGQNIQTGMITIGEIEDSINTEAIIVRDEEFLISPYDGFAIMEFAEGEKFPANYKLATIYDEASSKLIEDLVAMDSKILDYSSKRMADSNFFSEDLVKIDKQIKEQVLLIISQANDNALGKITGIRNEINRLMEKKTNISQTFGKPDVYFESLLSERERIKSLIDSHSKEFFSQKPGIISYHIDNYEIDLNPSGIDRITPSAFDKIEQVEPVDFINSVEVEMNKPFAKIISGVNYYLVVSLKRNEAGEFKEGASVRVRINDIDKLVNGTVAYISEEMDGKRVVSIKVDKYLSDTTSLRKVNIDLIKTYYEGFKVPLASLLRIDPLNMEADIVLVEANHATIKRVKIVGKNNEHAIIDNLDQTSDTYVKLFGIYVINPRNIQEGQVIDK